MSRNEIYTFGFRGFPDVQGGIENHAENLAPRVAKLGYQVTACVRSPYMARSKDNASAGVRVLRLWTVRNAYFETILHSVICAMVAGVRRPDVVHVHGIGPAIVTPLLRLFGLRVVVTHHGEDYNREKWGVLARAILRAGESVGMRFSHRRIAVSRSIGQLIETKYGKSCDVIPNGVVFSEFPVKADKLDEFGVSAGRYVLTVGRLVPEKRQLDLLRAFRSMNRNGWKLVVVGRIDHKNEYADRLAANAAGKDDVVMAGYQSGETLRQLYAHAGLFVLPSSHEGLPIVLLEALSYGLPVLVSDIPSNREIVADQDHIFKVGDCEELAGKMGALTAFSMDATEREAARRECTGRYDWSDIAAKTVDVYASLARKRTAQQPIGLSGRGSVFHTADGILQKSRTPEIISLSSRAESAVSDLNAARRR